MPKSLRTVLISTVSLPHLFIPFLILCLLSSCCLVLHGPVIMQINSLLELSPAFLIWFLVDLTDLDFFLWPMPALLSLNSPIYAHVPSNSSWPVSILALWCSHRVLWYFTLKLKTIAYSEMFIGRNAGWVCETAVAKPSVWHLAVYPRREEQKNREQQRCWLD